MSYGIEDRPPSVLVALRGAGKTYRTIEWLTEGKHIDTWPQWSRVLVVSSKRQAVWVVRTFSDTDVGMRFYEEAGTGLSKVVLYLEEFKNLRGIDLRPLEIAIDDADMLVEQILGRRPSWVTYSGESVSLVADKVDS